MVSLDQEWKEDQEFVKDIPFRPDFALQQQAFILCNLSKAVYLDSELSPVGRVASFTLPQLSGFATGPVTVTATLRDARLAAETGGVQFGVWEVEKLGVVVAFRGTTPCLQDIYADLAVMPSRLEAPASISDWLQPVQLHGGMYRGARSVCSDVADAYNNVVNNAQEQLPLFLTGHSLGGGYAKCTFFHALANHMHLGPPLSRGGVVTFGAPLVVASDTQPAALQALGKLYQLAIDGQAKEGTVAKLPIHSFVNNMDIVPRLLGTSLALLQPVLQKLLLMLPDSKLQAFLISMHEVTTKFIPLGNYHLFIGSSLRSTYSSTEKDLLHLGVKHIIARAFRLLDEGTSTLSSRLINDHYIADYIERLTACFALTKPLLFAGGSVADYLLTTAVTGGQQIVPALVHKATGLVCHSVLQEIGMSPSMQAKVAAQLGIKAKEVVSKWLPQASPGALEQVCRSTGPGGFSKGLAAVVKSVCCLVNVANLAASLVNMGLMFYTVHNIKSLNCKMDGVISSLDSIYGRLDSVECTLNSVTGGILQLETLLLDQQRFLAGMLQEMRAGQALILEAQSVTLNQLMHLRSQVDSLDKRLQATLDSLRTCQLHRVQELYSMAADSYLQFLQAHAGTSLHAGAIAVTACQNARTLKAMSESMLRTKLDDSKWDMSSPADIARRQPFVEAICFAAVAADACDAVLLGVPDSIKQRKSARELVASEIKSLLQGCTLYTLATSWRPVLQRYTFLRRGLYKSSGDTAFLVFAEAVLEVLPAHNAADLVWDDGLDELTSLLCRSVPLNATECPSQPRQLEATFRLNSLAHMTWWYSWRGLDPSQGTETDVVAVSDLLDALGMTENEQRNIISHLTSDDLPLLQQLVLPEYTRLVIASIDEQLPGCGILECYQQNKQMLRGCCNKGLANLPDLPSTQGSLRSLVPTQPSTLESPTLAHAVGDFVIAVHKECHFVAEVVNVRRSNAAGEAMYLLHIVGFGVIDDMWLSPNAILHLTDDVVNSCENTHEYRKLQKERKCSRLAAH